MSTDDKLYCIVTGANAGIGTEITKGLMRHGAHVVMACRNMDACEQVRSSLAASVGPGSCSCVHLDLGDTSSVRGFAAEQKRALRAGGRSLAVLVNNAGVMGAADGTGGGDQHLLVNHLGPFLLTRLLLPVMGQGGRVVNVASRAHYRGALHFDEAGNIDQHPSWWFPKYARSKLANVMFTASLAERPQLQQRGITAYSVSPGPVATSLFRYFPSYAQWLIQPLARTVFRTPEQGAASAVYAATSPEVAGRSVTFIHDNKPMSPARLVEDKGLRDKLWQASERLVLYGAVQGDEDSL